MRESGRVIVLGTPPGDAKSPRQATAQRALEGFVRSIGKEVRKGATAQLIYVGQKAEDQIESTLRFYLSPKSAYVSGQVVRIGASVLSADGIDWEHPAGGQVRAGHRRLARDRRAIAQVLARDGAHVIGLDVPGSSASSRRRSASSAARRSSSTSPTRTPRRGSPTHLLEHHGGVDVVVHNAGRHARQDARADVRRAVGHGASGST